MHIVITGSSKGIGSYIYDVLKKKHKVIGLSRSQSKRTTFLCDISSSKKVKDVFSKIKKIDVLINNASITEPLKNPITNFDITLKTNLSGTFYCSHYALKQLKKSKVKKIINISSINAHSAFPKNPGYVASKGGVNSLTRALALDYGPFGITVNSLSLGYVAAGMTKNTYKDLKKRKIRSERTILNRWGNPKDVVNAILFLISNKNSYITGSDIVLDGGWLAKGL